MPRLQLELRGEQPLVAASLQRVARREDRLDVLARGAEALDRELVDANPVRPVRAPPQHDGAVGDPVRPELPQVGEPAVERLLVAGEVVVCSGRSSFAACVSGSSVP